MISKILRKAINKKIQKEILLNNFLEKEMKEFGYRIDNLKSIKKIKSKKSFNICCIGDSITWGYVVGIGNKGIIQSNKNYPKVLQDKLNLLYPDSNISVINEGHPGWDSGDILNYLDNIILKKPNLSILMLGINDVLKKKNNVDYINNILEIIKRLKSSGSEVLVLTQTPINFFYTNKKIDRQVELLIEFLKKNKIPYIDLRAYLKEMLLILSEKLNFIISPDRLHLKPRRYSLIGEIIFRVLFK